MACGGGADTQSFPSGHSSLSFAGLGFLSFYLAGKMHIWHPHGHRNRAWVALLPLLGAAMVAISRTQDNRREWGERERALTPDHWHDVLIGSLLGYSVAYITYRAYYREFGPAPRGAGRCVQVVEKLTAASLHHPVCHLPLLPPASGDSTEDEYDAELNGGAESLLSEEGVPRQSEEAAAWQRSP